MPYYVYILLCKDGSYYTGYARDEVGVLYPAIADAKGCIIDGIHRFGVDPRWPV